MRHGAPEHAQDVILVARVVPPIDDPLQHDPIHGSDARRYARTGTPRAAAARAALTPLPEGKDRKPGPCRDRPSPGPTR